MSEMIPSRLQELMNRLSARSMLSLFRTRIKGMSDHLLQGQETNPQSPKGASLVLYAETNERIGEQLTTSVSDGYFG